MRKAVNPADVSTPPYYSQAIEASGFARTLYVSGQVGRNEHHCAPGTLDCSCLKLVLVLVGQRAPWEDEERGRLREGAKSYAKLRTRFPQIPEFALGTYVSATELEEGRPAFVPIF